MPERRSLRFEFGSSSWVHVSPSNRSDRTARSSRRFCLALVRHAAKREAWQDAVSPAPQTTVEMHLRCGRNVENVEFIHRNVFCAFCLKINRKIPVYTQDSGHLNRQTHHTYFVHPYLPFYPVHFCYFRKHSDSVHLEQQFYQAQDESGDLKL